MFILVTAATSNEVNITVDWLKQTNGIVSDNEVAVVTSGVGSAATSHSLTREIYRRKPDLVVQAGIAGSFCDNFPPLTTVIVKEEVFADLGVFSGYGFDDIFDLGLASADFSPFAARFLVNEGVNRWDNLSLPLVRGATVNCISSTQQQISTIVNKYNADVESMEGAALHYTCILENVPFVQLRTISNFAGERDKNKWMLIEAITELNSKLKELLTFHTD